MKNPRVLQDRYPNTLTLPLEVRQMVCANGETVEWSLMYGGIAVENLWLTGVTEVEAVRQLLSKAVRHG